MNDSHIGRHIIDITGQKFGSLLVLKCDGRDKHGQTMWECLCDCGNKTNVRSWQLRNGKVKSCGCSMLDYVPPNKLPPGESSFNTLYRDYIKRAKNADLVFELSKEEFRQFTKQKCYYCGREPRSIGRKIRRRPDTYIYNGLDRIDNSKGYTMDNCVTCCDICNRAKKNLALADFKTWISALVEHNG